MNQETYQCLVDVLDHMLPEERRHWEETGRPEQHIYLCLRQLEDWADEVAKDYS